MRLFAPLFLSLALVASGFAAPWTEARLEAMAAAELVAQAQVDELQANFEPNGSLEKYRREYEAAIPHQAARPVEPRALAKRLEAAPLVFLSDLHTLEVAQANTVRILKQMAKGGDLNLVIEWVDRADQAALDAFSAGRMTLSDLRQAIDYDQNWGFPWKGYAAIATAARKAGVPLIAVDSLRKKLSLGARDARITETLAKHRAAHPQSRYLVVYGCYHLAGKDHLPEKMAAAGFPPALTFVGDAPEAFWQDLKGHGELSRVRFLELKSGLFYIRNGTPLERILSHRDYLLELFGLEEYELVDQLDEVIADPARLFEALHAER